jgi:hypothetical protein
MLLLNTTLLQENQPFDFPGLKPGVCSGLILGGAFFSGPECGVRLTPKDQLFAFPDSPPGGFAPSKYPGYYLTISSVIGKLPKEICRKIL